MTRIQTLGRFLKKACLIGGIGVAMAGVILRVLPIPCALPLSWILASNPFLQKLVKIKGASFQWKGGHFVEVHLDSVKIAPTIAPFCLQDARITFSVMLFPLKLTLHHFQSHSIQIGLPRPRENIGQDSTLLRQTPYDTLIDEKDVVFLKSVENAWKEFSAGNPKIKVGQFRYGTLPPFKDVTFYADKDHLITTCMWRDAPLESRLHVEKFYSSGKIEASLTWKEVPLHRKDFVWKSDMLQAWSSKLGSQAMVISSGYLLYRTDVHLLRGQDGNSMRQKPVLVPAKNKGDGNFRKDNTAQSPWFLYLQGKGKWEKAAIPVHTFSIEGELYQQGGKGQIQLDFLQDSKLPPCTISLLYQDGKTILADAATHVQIPLCAVNQGWPQGMLEDARLWIRENLRQGVIAPFAIQAVFQQEKKDKWSLTRLHGKIPFSKLQVLFLEGMPPAERVSGYVDLHKDFLYILLTEGKIKDQKVKKGSIYIKGLDQVDQTFSLVISAKGPTQGLLNLLYYPPLRAQEAFPLHKMFVSGFVSSTLSIAFPLEKTLSLKDVALQAKVLWNQGEGHMEMENGRHIYALHPSLQFLVGKEGMEVTGSIKTPLEYTCIPHVPAKNKLTISKKSQTLVHIHWREPFHNTPIDSKQKRFLKLHASLEGALLTRLFHTMMQKDLPRDIKKALTGSVSTMDTKQNSLEQQDGNTLRASALASQGDPPVKLQGHVDASLCVEGEELTLTANAKNAAITCQAFPIKKAAGDPAMLHVTTSEGNDGKALVCFQTQTWNIQGPFFWNASGIPSATITIQSHHDVFPTALTLAIAKVEQGYSLAIQGPHLALQALKKHQKNGGTSFFAGFMQEGIPFSSFPLKVTASIKKIFINNHEGIENFKGEAQGGNGSLHYLLLEGKTFHPIKRGKQKQDKEIKPASFKLVFSRDLFSVVSNKHKGIKENKWNLWGWAHRATTLYNIFEEPFPGKVNTIVLKGTLPFAGKGAIKVKVSQAIVKKSQSLLPLLNLMPWGWVNLFKKGLLLKTIEAKGSLNQEYIVLEEVNGLGASIVLNMSGKINIKHEHLFLKGYLMPLGVFQDLFSKLPIFGKLWDMLGPGKGLMSIAFSASGPFAHPIFKVNPMGMVPIPLLNHFLDFFYHSVQNTQTESEKSS